MYNEYNIKYLKVATNPEIRPVSSKAIPKGELPKGILQRDGTRKQPIILCNTTNKK